MEPRFVVLSHPLRGDAPVWPGNPPAAEIELFESTDGGDIVNTTRLRLFSHSGTHVDTPWHFNPAGPAAWQLPIETFVFLAPRLVEASPREGRFITVADLEGHAEVVASADLLFLRTGWSIERERDPDRYASLGPLLHPDAARWLIDGHPGLRAIATDAISIGSPQEPDATVQTHHVLTGLGRTDGRYVLIYEDVRIVPEVDRAVRVYAWPLLIDGADGSPCTMVAELAPGGS